MIAYFILSSFCVAGCTVIHYESLRLVAMALFPRLHLRPARIFVIIGILSCMAAHVAEIWFFALVYYIFSFTGADFGPYASKENFFDFLSRSAESYTSLGYANASALSLTERLLLSTETLAGLVMIAWSASFTFLLMQRYWQNRSR